MPNAENWKLKFRAAKLSDLEQLKYLEQKVVEAERPYNPSIKKPEAYYYDIEHLILSGDVYLLVAEVDEVIVATGYAKIRPSKTSLNHKFDSYLGFMYVDPDCRGQAVNKRIVEYLIRWSQDKGVNDFYLDVYADNAAAINAYVKSGFSPSMIEMKLNL